jgi:hypothetical protein
MQIVPCQVLLPHPPCELCQNRRDGLVFEPLFDYTVGETVNNQVSGYNVHMEFFPPNPDILCLPPAETRLLEVRAEPYPDGKRLRVVIELTPFQQKPYISLRLSDSSGTVISEASIIEPATWKLEPTLHIRKPADTSDGPCKLIITLSYPNLGEVDHRDLSIEIPAPT